MNKRMEKVRRVLEAGGWFGAVKVEGYVLPGGNPVFKVRLFTPEGEPVPGVSLGTYKACRRAGLLEMEDADAKPAQRRHFLKPDLDHVEARWLAASGMRNTLGY